MPSEEPSRADRRSPQVALAYLRSSAKAGWQRVHGALVPNTQSAVAATIAWLIAHELFGGTNPIFAPIATYLCLGFSRNREPRRVVEVGIGATIGVFLGEVVTAGIGFGWWQLLVLLLVAPLIARFLASTDLLTFQTAINALVVGSMIQLATGVAEREASIGRWSDALIGAGVALVAAVVLPRSLTSRPRRYTSSALGGIADALEAIAQGLQQGEVGRGKSAYAALTVVRSQLSEGETAWRSASDMVLLNPARRTDRIDLAELDRLLSLADRLHGSVFMLARQAAGMIGESGAYPVIGELTGEAGRTLRLLARQVGRWEKPERARTAALELAGRLDPALVAGRDDWRGDALASMLRAIVVDLLQLTGLSVPQARAALPDIGALDVRSDEAEALPHEAVSDLWGTATFRALDDRGQPREDIPGTPGHRPDGVTRPDDTPTDDTPTDDTPTDGPGNRRPEGLS